MINKLLYKYYSWKIMRAQESMNLTMGIHNVEGWKLEKAGNISYIRAKAARDYYLTLREYL